MVFTVKQSGKEKNVILPLNKFDSVRKANLLKAHKLALQLPETVSKLRLSGSISLNLKLSQGEKEILVKNVNIQAADLTRNDLELPFWGQYQLGTEMGPRLSKEGQETVRGDFVLFKNHISLSNQKLIFEDAKVPQSQVNLVFPSDYPQRLCDINTKLDNLRISQWLQYAYESPSLGCPYIHFFEMSIQYDGTINVKPSLIRTAFKFPYRLGRTTNNWRIISELSIIKLTKGREFDLYSLPSSFWLYPPKAEELRYEPISVDLESLCPNFYKTQLILTTKESCEVDNQPIKVNQVSSKITLTLPKPQDKKLTTYVDSNSPWTTMKFDWLIKKDRKQEIYQNCHLNPKAQHFTFQCEKIPENASPMSQLTMRQLTGSTLALPGLGRYISINNDVDLRKVYCGDWENLLTPPLNGVLIAPSHVSTVIVNNKAQSLYPLNADHRIISFPFGASVEQCEGCFIETLPNLSVRTDQLCQSPSEENNNTIERESHTIPYVSSVSPRNNTIERKNRTISKNARSFSIGKLKSKFALIFVFGKNLSDGSNADKTWLGKWREDYRSIRQMVNYLNSPLEITVFFLYEKEAHIQFKKQLTVNMPQDNLFEAVYEQVMEPTDKKRGELFKSQDNFEAIDNQIHTVLNKLSEQWGAIGNYQVLILADKFHLLDLDGISQLAFFQGKGKRQVVLVDNKWGTKTKEINQKLGSNPNVFFINLRDKEWYKLAFEKFQN